MDKVFILDSSKVTASLIQRHLQQAGFVCDIAFSYEDAERLIAEKNYFVGLSSLVLEGVPSGKGLDLLIKNNIPAIAVTSNLDEDVLNDISQKDIVDYVLKKSEHIDYIVRIVKRVSKNRGLKVMVVDDSRAVRSWLSNILGHQGLTVLQAADGAEAAKVFYSNPDIKLVLTDYAMPKMDGLQLTAHLRTIRPMDELSIIVLSSDSKSRTAPLFLKTGANDFIHKSARIEEILCRVNSNLETLELIAESRDRANKDFLTGLWNRRYFFEHSEPLYAKYAGLGRGISVALMDIDHFKKVNDTYGHDAGDEVLKRFATLLADYIGERGLVARFGGEEFTVVFETVSSEDLKSVLEGFRELIESVSVEFEGDVISLTVSIGATSDMGESLTGMITRADEMLYEAKARGRNRVLFAE
ncbi:diguanylate cyclase [Maridesulfovibrio sp.]|uniref:GGDEF domain-containing response regulator n=1 Tax=Maridesulfovibrio sp. TaxID=2795000 RepID=UPI0029CA7435|nr:diguanylate cyclase [Maridesulfovibrio sp.]